MEAFDHVEILYRDIHNDSLNNHIHAYNLLVSKYT
jgi:hypothetical protein